jgi:hypothetical protein
MMWESRKRWAKMMWPLNLGRRKVGRCDVGTNLRTSGHGSQTVQKINYNLVDCLKP